jgi:hypothetical protein
MSDFAPLVPWLVVAPIVALVAYKEAAAFGAANGRPPWGLPPAAWAAAAVPSLLLAAILLAIAKKTTLPAPGHVADPATLPAPRPRGFTKPAMAFIAVSLTLLSVAFTWSGAEWAMAGNGYGILAFGLAITAGTALAWRKVFAPR